VTINSYTHSRTTSGHVISSSGPTVSGDVVVGRAASGHVISGAAVPLPVAARRQRRATCDGVASWSPTAAGGGRRTTSIIVRRHDAETKSFHEAAATLSEVDRDGRKQAAMASVVAHTVIHSFRGSSSSSTPDRLPDRTRKRPPGRPRSKRLDQIVALTTVSVRPLVRGDARTQRSRSFRGSLGLRLVAGCEMRGRRAINTAADW